MFGLPMLSFLAPVILVANVSSNVASSTTVTVSSSPQTASIALTSASTPYIASAGQYLPASVASVPATLQSSPSMPASVTTVVSTQVPLTVQISHLESESTVASAPASLQQVGNEIKEAVRESPSVSQIAVKFLKQFINHLPYFIVGILIFVFFWLISKLYNKILKKILGDDKKYKHNFSLVIRRLGSSFIILLGFVFALVVALPGFTPSKLLGALGFGSVILGFAFKDIFQNLLSGVLLLINEPFNIGDQIIVNNYEGTVENVRMRDTTICTYDNRLIVIPNAEIYKLAITVNTAYETRRLQIDVGISYDEDIDRVESIIQQALKKCDTVYHKESPIVMAIELADSTVNLRILWCIKEGTQMRKLQSMDEVIRQVKADLATANVDLPFPTQRVVIAKDTPSLG